MAAPNIIEKPEGYVDFETFLTTPEEFKSEWVQGKVIPMSPPNRPHGELTGFLFKVFDRALGEGDLGSVCMENFLMRLEGSQSGRIPDVMVILTQNEHRITKRYLDGAADLVVEIISKDSTKRDRGDKFVEYEAAGIPEYWLIDPERQMIDVYHLVDGRYQSADLSSGIITSVVVPNVKLRVRWLWQKPLPKMRQVFDETW